MLDQLWSDARGSSVHEARHGNARGLASACMHGARAPFAIFSPKKMWWLAARDAAMEDMEDEDLEAYYQRESFHWAMLDDDELERASTAAVDSMMRSCGLGGAGGG